MTKKIRAQQRQKIADKYMPMPPGITYWIIVKVQTANGEQDIRTPVTKPYPDVRLQDFENDDLVVLLRSLTREAIRRSLLNPGEPVNVDPPLSVSAETNANLLQASKTRQLGPGEACTIGPRP